MPPVRERRPPCHSMCTVPAMTVVPERGPTSAADIPETHGNQPDLTWANNCAPAVIVDLAHTQATSDIIFDCTHVKFCPGPCRSTTPESKPRDIGGKPWHAFKPYSGGRYGDFNYPMYNGGTLFLRNVRICGSCNSRWHDMIYDSEDREDMLEMSDIDAKRIIEKLKPALSRL